MSIPTNVAYMGANVGCIYNMPTKNYYNYYQCTSDREALEQLDKFIKSLKYKYLCAISSIYYQPDCPAILKQNRFEEVFSFYSSHGDARKNNEILTLWIKIQTDATYADKDTKISTSDIYNCTVGFHRNQIGKVFNLTVKFSSELNKDMRKLGFIRVKKTPVWFRLNSEAHRIETTK